MSGSLEMYDSAEVARVVAELAECKAKLETLESEQVETRRKHREDYEALHDAVAERNELRAKLTALEADNIANMQTCSGVIKGLQSELAALEGEPVEYQMLILGKRWTHCAKHIYDAATDRETVRALYAGARE